IMSGIGVNPEWLAGCGGNAQTGQSRNMIQHRIRTATGAACYHYGIKPRIGKGQVRVLCISQRITIKIPLITAIITRLREKGIALKLHRYLQAALGNDCLCWEKAPKE